MSEPVMRRSLLIARVSLLALVFIIAVVLSVGMIQDVPPKVSSDLNSQAGLNALLSPGSHDDSIVESYPSGDSELAGITTLDPSCFNGAFNDSPQYPHISHRAFAAGKVALKSGESAEVSVVRLTQEMTPVVYRALSGASRTCALGRESGAGWHRRLDQVGLQFKVRGRQYGDVSAQYGSLQVAGGAVGADLSQEGPSSIHALSGEWLVSFKAGAGQGQAIERVADTVLARFDADTKARFLNAHPRPDDVQLCKNGNFSVANMREFSPRTLKRFSLIHDLACSGASRELASYVRDGFLTDKSHILGSYPPEELRKIGRTMEGEAVHSNGAVTFIGENSAALFDFPVGAKTPNWEGFIWNCEGGLSDMRAPCDPGRNGALGRVDWRRHVVDPDCDSLGVPLEVVSTAYRDVTGDRRADVVLTTTCEAVTSSLSYTVQVFDGASSVHNPKLLGVLLTAADGTDQRGLRCPEISFNGGGIIVKSRGFAPNDPNSWPRYQVSDRFIWENGKFVRGARSVISTFN